MQNSDTAFYDEFRRRPPLVRFGLIALSCVVGVVAFLSLLSWRPTGDFATKSYFEVKTGTALVTLARELETKHLIRSPRWFQLWATLFAGPRGIKAGEYYFAEPLSTPRLAWRLTHASYGLVGIGVLLPEGSSISQMAVLLKKALPHFSTVDFLAEAKGKEGYLFPDTYKFLPSTSEREMVQALSANFQKKRASLERELLAFKRPLTQIVTMASLVEEEGRTTETRRTIAGILWKRLDAKMPLQVDSVFPYLFGDKPYDLTDGDLLVDSPYNTYRYKGLPPTPITNPGIEAIRDTVTPIATKYWYYLSDKDGTMHYAVTHDEHLANRAKYLDL